MGRAPCCEKFGLKRGKWTAEEDQILINYIQANGEGSWRSLPKNAGLLRCGKSCRLRWINYLRADLKRGNITPHEEETIVKLHAAFGNRWSLIAGQLSGRTDNEIKNYWNSHLSRKIYSFASTLKNVNIANIPSSTGKPSRGGRTTTKKHKVKKSVASEVQIDAESREIMVPDSIEPKRVGESGSTYTSNIEESDGATLGPYEWLDCEIERLMSYSLSKHEEDGGVILGPDKVAAAAASDQERECGGNWSTNDAENNAEIWHNPGIDEDWLGYWDWIGTNDDQWAVRDEDNKMSSWSRSLVDSKGMEGKCDH